VKKNLRIKDEIEFYLFSTKSGNCLTDSIFDNYNHSLRYSYVKMQFNAETDFIFLSHLMLFDMTREAKAQ
jgi:hypothetical protein